MVSIEHLRNIRNELYQAAGAKGMGWEAALAAADNPTDEDLVAAAIPLIGSEDRNERVLALRFIANTPRDDTAAVLLAGLNDPARRVREVALKCTRNFRERSEVIGRLREILEDETEKRRLRGMALHQLIGGPPGLGGTPPSDVALEVLRDLISIGSHRQQILERLISAELTPEVKGLLDDFVRDGSKDEAVLATRALAGWRMAHICEFGRREDDAAAIRHVESTYERVFPGRVYFWIPRKGSPVEP